MTMIAVMDETGFCQFASIGNVAHRARVTVDEAEVALTCLESADPDSGDPDHEGRRVERVPGGWVVLNAQKHRSLVTRAVKQEQTRERVRRWRERKKNNAAGNAPVTPSETETEVRTEVNTTLSFPTKDGGEWFLTVNAFEQWVSLYPSLDVQEEIGAAAAWIDANPEKRKLGKSMPRFCVAWLNKAREQRRGTNTTGGYRGTGIKL